MKNKLATCLLGMFLLVSSTSQSVASLVDYTKFEFVKTEYPILGEDYPSSPFRIEANESPMTREIQCLAENIYFEARGEGRQGMIAVAYVTKNRMESSRFPDTICGVVYQSNSRGCQFSWTCDGHADKVRDQVSWERAREIAQTVLGGTSSEQDPTKGATFYHTASILPYWADSMVRTATLGNHIFYR